MYMKIGFLGLGVMGLPMAKNLVKKSGCEVLGFDVAQNRLDEFAAAGGTPVKEQTDIYKQCDIIMQILPTHAIIRKSVEDAVHYGKRGNIIIDLSSTAPDIIQDLYKTVKEAGMYLLDSPISGGNPMAIAGTLAIMTGGDKEVFESVKPLLECMGHPVYTGGSGSGRLLGKCADAHGDGKGQHQGCGNGLTAQHCIQNLHKKYTSCTMGEKPPVL